MKKVVEPNCFLRKHSKHFLRGDNAVQKLISYTDYCPFLNRDYTATVTYCGPISLTLSEFRKEGFRCDYASRDACPHASQCPIFVGAPDVIS